MSGNTHAALGAFCGATACTLTGNTDMFTLLLGVTFGAVSALAPDIDVDGSIGNKAVKRSIPIAIISLALVCFCISVKGSKISFLGMGSKVIAIIVLLLMTLLGMGSPHREKTHSIVYCIVSSLCVLLLYAPAAFFWCVGYGSHLVADLFNTKGCSYAWPMKKKWCLGLCKANGAVNTGLMYCGIVFTVVTVILAMV